MHPLTAINKRQLQEWKDEEFGLKRFGKRLVKVGTYLYVSPIRKGSTVNSNTSMAGWSENAKDDG